MLVKGYSEYLSGDCDVCRDSLSATRETMMSKGKSECNQ